LKKVLVIDDEAIIRVSCKRTLASEGFHVSLASSCREGLELLDNESFDLLLLDLKMPDMDGIELLPVIRSRWPEIKVIVISGYATDQTAEDTAKLGAHKFLGKPFTPEALIAAITDALSL
jgi:two-component system response regulator HydG